MLFSALMSIYVSTIVLFVIDLFELNERDLGLFMLMVGRLLAFNQMVVVKRMMAMWGSAKTLQGGLLLSTLGFFLITQTDSMLVYVGFYYLLNLGIAMCIPTLNTILAEHGKPETMGETMGISNGIMSLSYTFVPIVAAYVYGQMDINLWVSASLAFTGSIAVFNMRRSWSLRHNHPIALKSPQMAYPESMAKMEPHSVRDTSRYVEKKRLTIPLFSISLLHTLSNVWVKWR